MIVLNTKPKQNGVARRAKIIANAHMGGPACLSDEVASILLPFNSLINAAKFHIMSLRTKSSRASYVGVLYERAMKRSLNSLPAG